MPSPDPTDAAAKDCSYAWFYDRSAVVTIATSICLCFGLAYALLQWQRTRAIKDGLFIGLLLGATLLLLQGMRAIFRYVKNNVMSFYAFSLEKKSYADACSSSEAFCRSIFHAGRMSLSGLVYGLAIGSSVFLMDAWPEDPPLRLLLFAFLFVVNFVTGIGFYGVVRFFAASWKLAASVRIDLWQRVNPTTTFFMKVKKKAALLATVYITMSITSIFFSEILREQSLSLAYIAFAGLLIILVFVLPEIPLRNKILAAKRKALATLNAQLQEEFHNSLDEASLAESRFDLQKIERLILLKEKIERVSIWPFGLQTLGTVLSVLGITVLPIVLEFLLNRFVGK